MKQRCEVCAGTLRWAGGYCPECVTGVMQTPFSQEYIDGLIESRCKAKLVDLDDCEIAVVWQHSQLEQAEERIAELEKALWGLFDAITGTPSTEEFREILSAAYEALQGEGEESG